MAKTIELLDQLARGPLPRIVTRGDELDRLRFLRAAGWVDAIIRGRDGPAVVREITFAGQAIVQKAREYGAGTPPRPAASPGG